MDYTVSGYLDRLNLVLGPERAFVIGEVTGFRTDAKWTGFSLKDKDDEAILKCVMPSWQYRRSGLELADGMQVKVGGFPRMTKRYGSLGFWADSLELVGEGALKRAYEDLKKRLTAEGLFARKRAIPECISRIGVITSKSGVVIHDFTKNLKKKHFSILLRDSRVEGADAVNDLLSAIAQFNRRNDIDVLVVIRGGGSLESLQSFNDERVCRALFSSKVPVIAGIGHDVDVPLAAMVADVMVSTPTAAAVLVGRSWDLVDERFRAGTELLFDGFEGMLSGARHELLRQTHSIIGGYRKIFLTFSRYEQAVRNGWIRITRDLRQAREHSTRLSQRVSSRFARVIEQQRDVLTRTEKLLELMNPERNLRLGYNIAFDSEGNVVKSAKSFKKGESFTTKFKDGSVRAKVDEVLL